MELTLVRRLGGGVSEIAVYRDRKRLGLAATADPARALLAIELIEELRRLPEPEREAWIAHRLHTRRAQALYHEGWCPPGLQSDQRSGALGVDGIWGDVDIVRSPNSMVEPGNAHALLESPQGGGLGEHLHRVPLGVHRAT